MKTSFALLSALLSLAFVTLLRAQDRPNVLLIAIDDLNDWVGCLGGHPQARTPHIDRLAARGVLFSNAHCQAPICNPSRTSLMLGMRPSTTGIYVNQPWFRSTPANRQRVTMTEWFGEHGYHTLTTGKIFHGSRVDQRSFQTVGPRPGQRISRDQQVVTDIASRSKLWDFGPQRYPQRQFPDYVDASWAAERLKQPSEKEKSFFLAVGFYRPHVPLYAPERFFDDRPLSDTQLPAVLDDDRDDLPKAALMLTANPTPPPHQWFVDSGRWRAAVQSYLACVTFMDTQVGRLLDALDSSGHKQNTIIVLFSDHGFHLGEKQRWAKQSLWECSTRVPLIVAVPDGRQGARCSRPVELLSLYPTLLELCGLPPRDSLEGVSLTPLLDNSQADWSRPAISTYQQNNHAVRSEHFRYIRYADGAEELYDHRQDRHEWDNLAADPAHAKVMAEHRKWLPKTNAPDAARAP